MKDGDHVTTGTVIPMFSRITKRDLQSNSWKAPMRDEERFKGTKRRARAASKLANELRLRARAVAETEAEAERSGTKTKRKNSRSHLLKYRVGFEAMEKEKLARAKKNLGNLRLAQQGIRSTMQGTMRLNGRLPNPASSPAHQRKGLKRQRRNNGAGTRGALGHRRYPSRAGASYDNGHSASSQPVQHPMFWGQPAGTPCSAPATAAAPPLASTVSAMMSPVKSRRVGGHSAGGGQTSAGGGGVLSATSPLLGVLSGNERTDRPTTPTRVTHSPAQTPASTASGVVPSPVLSRGKGQHSTTRPPLMRRPPNKAAAGEGQSVASPVDASTTPAGSTKTTDTHTQRLHPPSAASSFPPSSSVSPVAAVAAGAVNSTVSTSPALAEISNMLLPSHHSTSPAELQMLEAELDAVQGEIAESKNLEKTAEALALAEDSFAGAKKNFSDLVAREAPSTDVAKAEQEVKRLSAALTAAAAAAAVAAATLAAADTALTPAATPLSALTTSSSAAAAADTAASTAASVQSSVAKKTLKKTLKGTVKGIIAAQRLAAAAKEEWKHVPPAVNPKAFAMTGEIDDTHKSFARRKTRFDFIFGFHRRRKTVKLLKYMGVAHLKPHADTHDRPVPPPMPKALVKQLGGEDVVKRDLRLKIDKDGELWVHDPLPSRGVQNMGDTEAEAEALSKDQRDSVESEARLEAAEMIQRAVHARRLRVSTERRRYRRRSAALNKHKASVRIREHRLDPNIVAHIIAGGMYKRHIYKADQFIVRGGNVDSECYYIEQGAAVAEIGGKTVRGFTAGEYFGEMAIVTFAPRSADVVSVGETICLSFARAAFDTLPRAMQKEIMTEVSATSVQHGKGEVRRQRRGAMVRRMPATMKVKGATVERKVAKVISELEWKCATCMVRNVGLKRDCKACGHRRPPPPRSYTPHWATAYPITREAFDEWTLKRNKGRKKGGAEADAPPPFVVDLEAAAGVHSAYTDWRNQEAWPSHADQGGLASWAVHWQRRFFRPQLRRNAFLVASSSRRSTEDAYREAHGGHGHGHGGHGHGHGRHKRGHGRHGHGHSGSSHPADHHGFTQPDDDDNADVDAALALVRRHSGFEEGTSTEQQAEQKIPATFDSGIGDSPFPVHRPPSSGNDDGNDNGDDQYIEGGEQGNHVDGGGDGSEDGHGYDSGGGDEAVSNADDNEIMERISLAVLAAQARPKSFTPEVRVDDDEAAPEAAAVARWGGGSTATSHRAPTHVGGNRAALALSRSLIQSAPASSEPSKKLLPEAASAANMLLGGEGGGGGGSGGGGVGSAKGMAFLKKMRMHKKKGGKNAKGGLWGGLKQTLKSKRDAEAQATQEWQKVKEGLHLVQTEAAKKAFVEKLVRAARKGQLERVINMLETENEVIDEVCPFVKDPIYMDTLVQERQRGRRARTAGEVGVEQAAQDARARARCNLRRERDGVTALFAAAAVCAEPVVKYLLGCGANRAIQSLPWWAEKEEVEAEYESSEEGDGDHQHSESGDGDHFLQPPSLPGSSVGKKSDHDGSVGKAELARYKPKEGELPKGRLEEMACGWITPLAVCHRYELPERMAPIYLERHERKQRTARILEDVGIHGAAKAGNIRRVRWLLNNGQEDGTTLANLDDVNMYGMSPLHYAAAYAHEELAVYLTENAADPGKANNLGHTPLDFAESLQYNTTRPAKVKRWESGSVAVPLTDQERMMGEAYTNMSEGDRMEAIMTSEDSGLAGQRAVVEAAQLKIREREESEILRDARAKPYARATSAANAVEERQRQRRLHGIEAYNAPRRVPGNAVRGEHAGGLHGLRTGTAPGRLPSLNKQVTFSDDGFSRPGSPFAPNPPGFGGLVGDNYDLHPHLTDLSISAPSTAESHSGARGDPLKSPPRVTASRPPRTLKGLQNGAVLDHRRDVMRSSALRHVRSMLSKGGMEPGAAGESKGKTKATELHTCEWKDVDSLSFDFFSRAYFNNDELLDSSGTREVPLPRPMSSSLAMRRSHVASTNPFRAPWNDTLDRDRSFGDSSDVLRGFKHKALVAAGQGGAAAEGEGKGQGRYHMKGDGELIWLEGGDEQHAQWGDGGEGDEEEEEEVGDETQQFGSHTMVMETPVHRRLTSYADGVQGTARPFTQ